MPETKEPPGLDLGATVAALMHELETLGRIIEDARAEVAALRADDDAPDIPSATDELAAIVSHTAQATHEIIDSCERLEEVSARIGSEHAVPMEGAITRIYEACSFQDITGQRIAKVVAALQAIERRVTKAREDLPPRPSLTQAAEKPVQLLNGPQLPGNGISQSAIDALFD
jgi:chemotaxis protein CheZ